MAKADDTISDWIELHEALTLAVTALGSSRALAEKKLRQWLTSGELPWDCMDWEGLDEEGLAKLKQSLGAVSPHASEVFHRGAPQFWGTILKIDWEDNVASEPVVEGAQAWGIRVPLARLLALLPAAPRESVEEQGQTKPAERELMDPNDCLAELCKEHPRQRRETMDAYACRLYALMKKAPVTKLWPFKTLKRRLYDK